jgi:hypothetical protein
VKALPGNPYDGHTLATVIPDMEALIGNTVARILADKGYRGHNAPPDYRRCAGTPLDALARRSFHLHAALPQQIEGDWTACDFGRPGGGVSVPSQGTLTAGIGPVGRGEK